MIAIVHTQYGASTVQIQAEPIEEQSSLPLSPNESTSLQQCEGVISRHLAAFFEVGNALRFIRDNRLYRAEFKTFEEYCRGRWDMGRFHAYRKIQGAEVMQHLANLGNMPLPDNERQVRGLTAIPPKEAALAWKLAIEKAGPKKPTAKIVLDAVRTISKCSEATSKQPRQNWQRLLEPILAEALIATKGGDQDKVESLLNKGLLISQIGKDYR